MAPLSEPALETAPVDGPLPSYGPIASRLIQARELADSDLVLLHIDTALMLVRQAHHSRTLKAYYAGGAAATA